MDAHTRTHTHLALPLARSAGSGRVLEARQTKTAQGTIQKQDKTKQDKTGPWKDPAQQPQWESRRHTMARGSNSNNNSDNK